MNSSGYATTLAVGDFNGDGNLDLAILGRYALDISLGNGDLDFSGPAISQLPLTLSAALGGVGDLNSDGFDDVVTVPQHGFSGPGVSLSKGDGTFTPTNLLAGVSKNVSILAAAVGDVNGDGIPDIVAVFGGNSSFPGALYVYAGVGDGTFNPPVFAGALPNTLSEFAVTATIGDVNGGGIADIVITDRNNSTANGMSTIRVLFGSGRGVFQPFVIAFSGTLEDPNASLSTVIVDLNGDGVNDIAALLQGQLITLLGDRRSTFTVLYAVDNLSTQIATGDFNGDGIPDLATAIQHTYQKGGTINLYLGRGNGQFTYSGPLSTGLGTAGVVVADFNDDGIPDLASINDDSGDVTILINDGQANFAYQGSWAFTEAATGQIGAAGHFSAAGNIGLVGSNGQVISVITDLTHLAI